MIRLIATAATLALPNAGLAATPAEETAKDVRCLIVVSELADSKDKETETAGLIASQYFLGRIDGRSPGVDLQRLLIREAEKLTDADRPTLLVSCGNQLEERGRYLEKIGKSISEKG
jgi:hypothetical protein